MPSSMRAHAQAPTPERRQESIVVATSYPELDPLKSCAYESIKTILDFCWGLILLFLFTPIILLAAIAVRLTTPGPAFYTQTRIGKGGRVFRIIKIRTMYHNCETISGIKWSTAGDARITRIGRFLRLTHLDELPQLLNVLRGEMSLVGPRPERPEIIQGLEKAIPHYHRRHEIRPGITGLAQLRLSADSCVQGVRHKLAYDLHYIRNMGPWLDLRLLTCTCVKMFRIPLTEILWLCQIPSDRTIGFQSHL